MERHVIVVSVDAMVYEDIETLSRLSAFRDRWPQTARVNRVRSVYPTITYPCHTTMQTGLYRTSTASSTTKSPSCASARASGSTCAICIAASRSLNMPRKRG